MEFEHLAGVGCRVEAALARDLGARLPDGMPARHSELIRRQVQRTAEHLDGVPWLSEDAASSAARAQAGPVRVYLVRHAESTGNQEQRLLGVRIHGALTPLGQAQSRRTADYLSSAFRDLRDAKVLLVSSPVGRALETARPIGARLGCPVSSEPNLAELDIGDWTGKYFSELEADPAYRQWMQDKWFCAPPGGESMFEVRTRACEALAGLVLQARRTGSVLIVVTHFFPLMAIFDVVMLGTNIRPDNSSISCFDYAAGHWSSSFINSTAHLGEDGAKPVGYV
ncbi:MAG: histidine phosphatase family protein [Betaproteobacteria bacterium]|nr:histidine phosphatase family protein [Betaproteobacteria bacterium]